MAFHPRFVSKMIHFGTCGFSYEDWREVFYPADLSKSDFLSYYAEHFNALELNSSYYAIPRPQLIDNLIRLTGDDFKVVVKAYQGITHQRDESPERDLEQFLRSIAPLAEAGKLAAVLLQFPYSFHYGESELGYLDNLLSRVPEFLTVVEFRHASWMKRRTLECLQSHAAGFCCVDEPPLRGLMPPESICTSVLIGYVRFHGRNAKKWWDNEKSWERYEYNYNDEELSGWLPGIRWLESKTEQTYIFFNNHRAGAAVENTRRMNTLLSLGD